MSNGSYEFNYLESANRDDLDVGDEIKHNGKTGVVIASRSLEFLYINQSFFHNLIWLYAQMPKC